MKKKITSMILLTAMLLCVMAFADKSRVYADTSGQQIRSELKGTLEVNTPTEIFIEKDGAEVAYYAAYAFKTSFMKSYYGVSLKKAEGVNWDPTWYLVTDINDREGTKVVWGTQLGNWADFGSTLGNNAKLKVDTTYYLCISSHGGYDFKATVTIKENMDGEGDTAELSEPAIPNVTKYGALDNRSDVDVFELEGKNDYTLEMKADKKIKFEIYSDAALETAVFTDADKDIKKDLSAKISAGKKYYVVIKYSGEASSDPKGDPIIYEFTFKSASTSSGSGGGGSDVGGGGGSDVGGGSDIGGGSGGSGSGGSGSGSSDTGSYQSALKSAKSMITNMTSSNTYKIKGKKLVIKRGKNGYLFQKSKYKGGVFHKSKNLRKKTYKLKLAKNYRIVYGAKEDGSGDSKKTKTWFNKAYKNKKGSTRANVNLFLNKKNEIVLIYISSWDIGAEQTD